MENLMLNLNKQKILVIAAHPDDEILGCGGTLIKLKSLKCEIEIIFMTNGVSSRNLKNPNKKILERKKSTKNVAKFIGIKKIHFLNLPDNKLDSVPLLNIIKKIKKLIKDYKPNHIFTHSEFDLNIDHRITYNAVLTSTRPEDIDIKSLICFEIPSSTDYSFNYKFRPNLFIDIQDFYNKKLTCLKFYNQELRPFPHPRSYENIKNLSQIRGSSVGHKISEAFEIKKLII
tara:strand:+ start:7682 stop:8371 length:690 start_codon:yes stop_codon:yes gene_type:complete